MENDICMASVRASTGEIDKPEIGGAAPFVETPRTRFTGLKRPLLFEA